MTEITATDAARRFADLLDAIEHRGEHFTIVRRGNAIARLEPVPRRHGRAAKELLRRHRRDPTWAADVAAVRALVEIEDRG